MKELRAYLGMLKVGYACFLYFITFYSVFPQCAVNKRVRKCIFSEEAVMDMSPAHICGH